MALNKANLAAALKLVFEEMAAIETDEPPVAPILAQKLADAIDAYVRDAVVTGVQVSVSINATTSTSSGHSHTVTQTVTGTQSVNGHLT